MTEWASLIRAIAALLSTLIWPALVFFIVLRFRGPITSFLRDLGELSFKAPGVEATLRRQQEAAANLGAAVVASRMARGEDGTLDQSAPEITEIVDALPNSRQQRRLDRSRVLWVDDRPENNTYEVRALEALGLRVDISRSTPDALARQSSRPYDLIISDMGRPPDSRAGYTLLDHLRSVDDRTPFVIYAASRDSEHSAEAKRHGALGCTNRPQELLNYVRDGLGA